MAVPVDGTAWRLCRRIGIVRGEMTTFGPHGLTDRPGVAGTSKRSGLFAVSGSSRVRGFALVCALGLSGCATEAPVVDPAPPVDRPNVLVIVVDCLRADRLGIHGMEGGLTPTIDALATDPGGITFDTVVAPATWTKPSVASLFSGVYPQEHGIQYVGREGDHGLETQHLSPEFTTLAEHFQAGGYATVAVLNQVHITHESGFSQGFDHFEQWRGKGAVFLNRKMIEWWKEHFGTSADFSGAVGMRRAEGADESSKSGSSELEAVDGSADPGPFFAYLHYLDAHWPYNSRLRDEDPAKFVIEPRPPGKGNLAQPWIDAIPEADRPEVIENLLGRYDREVRLADKAIHDVIRTLRRAGELNDTIIVVTADHGEAFMERGLLQHGHDPHEELVRIPMIIHLPPSYGVAPVRVQEPVTLVDLMPTLLGLVGLPIPEGSDGRDLRPLWERAGGADSEFRDRPIVSEGLGSLGVRTSTHKMIRSGEETIFYELGEDPGEVRPIDRAECGAPCDRLVQSARQYLERERRIAPGSGSVLSEQEIEDLESLGYL